MEPLRVIYVHDLFCLFTINKQVKQQQKTLKEGFLYQEEGEAAVRLHFTTAMSEKDVFYQLFPALLRRVSTNLLLEGPLHVSAHIS